MMDRTNPPLTRLEYADLIRRLQDVEATYQFKHNLIQESAYESLLKNDRRTLHRACAHALEQSFAKDLDEYAALLAKHYAEAGDDAKTFEYARRGGEYAMGLSAYAEALMLYDTAVAVGRRLDIPTADLTEVHRKRGRVLELMGQYTEAVEAYRGLQALGQARGAPHMELTSLLALATLYIFPNNTQDLERGLEVNQEALALAQQLQDEEAQARALWNMQQHAYFSGHASDAVEYSRQALAITDRAGLRELRAYILNDVSRAQIGAESISAALESLREAREIWRALNNLPMLIDNLATVAEAAQVGGKIELGYDFVRQAQELGQTTGNLWNLAYSGGIGMTLDAHCGETRRALESAPQVARQARASGFAIAEYITDIVRAGIYGNLGDPHRGLALLRAPRLDESLRFVEPWRSGMAGILELQAGDLAAVRKTIADAEGVVNWSDLSTFGPIYLMLCRSELAQREGDFQRGLEEAKKMAERLRTAEIEDFLPELLLSQSRAHFGLEEYTAAEKVLDEAEGVARRTKARFALMETLAARGEFARAQGQTQDVRGLQEMRELIGWLAEHAPLELRATFLAQPKIRARLER